MVTFNDIYDDKATLAILTYALNCLLPQKDNYNSLKFRPIGLFNDAFKIVTKVFLTGPNSTLSLTHGFFSKYFYV